MEIPAPRKEKVFLLHSIIREILMKVWFGGMIFLCLLIGMISCDTYPPNQPLKKAGSRTAYCFQNVLQSSEGLSENFIILSLSGGGTRASTMAYGVLKHLRDVKSGSDQNSLLDQVNVISSVSGGSFAAAYFGLYGQKRFFSEFPEKVLYCPIQRRLEIKLLNPCNWFSLMSPTFGRSELAEAVYAEDIFGNHTFADLPLKWPFIIINATDMARGAQFAFTQDYFNLIASDLSSFPISRAVTASSAYPFWFSPVTLNNYPPVPGRQKMPQWVTEALAAHPYVNPVIYGWAQTWKSFEEEAKRPYLHLIDGSIADFLGTRPPAFAVLADTWSIFRNADQTKPVRRVVVIVVDARPRNDPGYDRSPDAPGVITTLKTAALEPVMNYAADTVAIIQLIFDELQRANRNYELFRKMCEELAQLQPTEHWGTVEDQVRQCVGRFRKPYGQRPPFADFYLIHITFDALKDAALRHRIEAIPTSLQLPSEDVDLVIETASELVNDSPEFQRLCEDLSISR